MARYVISQSNGRVFVIEETPNGNAPTLDVSSFWDLVEFFETEGITESIETKTYFLTPDRFEIFE